MSSPLIRATGLVKRFGEVVAVAGLDLSIGAGQCIGLLGPNGAGKTTTVEMLEGIQTPDSGEIELLGRTWARDGEYLRSRIGISLQETDLYMNLTVWETVRLFRSFYPSGLGIDEAVELVGLQEKRDSRIRTLSGGQKQRVSLAIALAGDPELLFLDEPTTGLDPQSRRSFWEVLEALKRRGRTLLLTTHAMDEAERLCDRVLIIDRGKKLAEGTPAELVRTVGGAEIVDLQTSAAVPLEGLKAAPGMEHVKELGSQRWQLAVAELHRSLPPVLDAVRAARAEVVELTVRRPTLDDVFLNLTGRKLQEETAP